jgi:deoxyribodipyrimidine photo-lyase
MTSALVWFRRDLRDFDHAALAHALRLGQRVYCAFIFDRDILDALPNRSDRRVDFILRAVNELDAALRAKGSGLIVRHARAVEAIPRLAAELGVATVHANRDHEPLARQRDAAVAAALAAAGRRFCEHKDQTIFERDEVLTRQGTPFAVFTPYARAWRAQLTPADLAPHDCTVTAGQLAVPPAPTVIDRATLGFSASDLQIPCGMSGGAALLADFLTRIGRYHETRDFPSVKGCSYLSPHLRFGTVSIRQLVATAHALSLQNDGGGAAVWLNELIWREFYQMILWQRPDVVTQCFKPACDALRWADDPAGFTAGRPARPAIRWSMPRSASCCTAAGCTIACA